MKYNAALLGILAAWNGAASAADAPAVQWGQAVHDKWCQPCHGDGNEFPGTVAIRAKYAGKVTPVLAQRTDLTPDMIRYFVRNGVSVMPPFRKTEVSAADLEALVAYLTRNSGAGTR